MTHYIDKSALVAEIERRLEKIANASSSLENNRELYAIYGAQIYELINLVQYINTLEVKEVKEEPVSEDLEKAAKNYCVGSSFYDACMENPAFIAGANWQKEQMLAKAITAHCFGFQGDALFSFRLPAKDYLVGSKVKVIIIKED